VETDRPQHDRLAVLSPNSIPPPPPPHCAVIPVRKNVGAFQNLISFFTAFEIALTGDFVLSKSILTNLYI
jgi:hypothetical protein